MAEKKATKTTKTTKTNNSKTAKKSIAGSIIGAIIAAIVIIAAVIGITVLVDNLTKGAKPGTYELSAIKTGDEDKTESISLLKALGLSAEITINDDKSCDLSLFGEDLNCSYDKENLTINGSATQYTYTDTTITFEYNGNELTFTKE